MQAWFSGTEGPFPGRPRQDRREIRARAGSLPRRTPAPPPGDSATFLSSGELHMGPGQDSALIQEVAKPKASSSSSGRAEPSGETFRRNPRTPRSVSSASITNGRRSIETSRSRSRSGRRRVAGQLVLASSRASDGAERPRARSGAAAGRTRRPPAWAAGAAAGSASASSQSKPAGRHFRQPAEQARPARIGSDSSMSTTSLQALDPQAQRQGEDDLGPGLESLAHRQGDARRGMHPLRQRMMS